MNYDFLFVEFGFVWLWLWVEFILEFFVFVLLCFGVVVMWNFGGEWM